RLLDAGAPGGLGRPADGDARGMRRSSDMKYLCLVYGTESALQGMDDAECVAFDNELRASGHCIASEALEPVATAATVRVRSGRATVVDGPFAETKEQLAGFYMIEARDLNEAIRIDRKSTRLNSSHVKISYAVFCLKKKKRETPLESM